MSEEIKEFELPCGMKVISVPGWGDPMFINFTNWPQEAKAAVRVPNNWEYEIVDEGMGAYKITGTPIYDDKRPKHIYIKDAVVLKGLKT